MKKSPIRETENSISSKKQHTLGRNADQSASHLRPAFDICGSSRDLAEGVESAKLHAS